MSDAELLVIGDINVLCEHFPAEQVLAKPQVVKGSDALMVAYLPHPLVASRLDRVTPTWEFAVSRCYTAQIEEWEDKKKVVRTLYYCEATLTIKGVSRGNVGDGKNPKDAYSDALKRCAMIFGVGRYLYESKPAWVKGYDKNHTYTLAELGGRAGNQPQPPQQRPTPTAPPGNGASKSRPSGDTAQAAEELEGWLLEMNVGDTKAAQDELEEITTFEGTNGPVAGVRTVDELLTRVNRDGNPARFWRAYQEVKKEIYPLWRDKNPDDDIPF